MSAAGLLLGFVVQRLTNMSAADQDEPLKMTMLSAVSRAFSILFVVSASQCRSLNMSSPLVQHDTTVMALQFSMNVSNGLQPPYASCHIFELYRDQKG